MSSYSTGANGVTPNCQHCGRPVVGAAVYGNQGEPYHPSCTQPAPTQPMATREVFDIREARERIADLERQLAEAESYPGIAHDFETVRRELEEARTEIANRAHTEEQYRLRIEDLERQLAAYQWQPLETAPKNGDMFIAYQNGSVYECRWVEYPPDLDHRGSAGFLDMTNDGIEYPTHWMPLPEPPKA